MTITYPAIFTRHEDGSYEGYFPDLDGCVFSGKDIDEAINSAIEEEKNWIAVELEEDNGLPYVSDREDVELEENQFWRDIAVIIHMTEGWEE